MADTDDRIRLIDIFEDVLARCATDGIDPAGELADAALRFTGRDVPVVTATEDVPRPLVAVRTVRVTGRAHLHVGPAQSPGQELTQCGLILSNAELVPWLQTAAEDRCTRCVELDAAR